MTGVQTCALPISFARADARGLLRVQARKLLARLEAAQGPAGRQGKADTDTAVFLADSVDTLRQALAAPLQRQGF